ncbi:MAG: LysM domain-containing protein [Gammaproteobacteria bacterium]|nr:LysM domain-containing protein [Gammaproteobacteria bacterium]MBU1724520.1 LysM domain-containing protein [Gammaproteobacteria bacterium]MBU2004563.1 LysM domain-containing protein [Gammaproteobacteria bacterium]
MTKGFIFAVGVVLALWFVSVCNRVPLFTVALPTVTTVPYYPSGHVQPVRYGASCRMRHVVGQGETQWSIAVHYSNGQEKAQWLRQMRRTSNLATDDDHLYPGQVLCVGW